MLISFQQTTLIVEEFILNSFVDGNGNAYQIDQINNPEDTILILYSDGNEENINTDERMSNGRSWGTFKQMLCYSKNK